MKQESDQNFLMPVSDKDDVNLNQDDNWISSIGQAMIWFNQTFFSFFFFHTSLLNVKAVSRSCLLSTVS